MKAYDVEIKGCGERKGGSMKGSLQSTAEVEPESGWPQWTGRGTMSCGMGGGLMQLIFILNSKFNPGYRDQDLGPSQSTSHRIWAGGGGKDHRLHARFWRTVRASCLVVVIRDDVTAPSF